VYSYAQLNIRGTDLLSVGIRGVGVGEMLKKALFAVMEGICENKKEKLLSYIVEQATLGGDIHAV